MAVLLLTSPVASFGEAPLPNPMVATFEKIRSECPYGINKDTCTTYLVQAITLAFNNKTGIIEIVTTANQILPDYVDVILATATELSPDNAEKIVLATALSAEKTHSGAPNGNHESHKEVSKGSNFSEAISGGSKFFVKPANPASPS